MADAVANSCRHSMKQVVSGEVYVEASKDSGVDPVEQAHLMFLDYQMIK